MTNPNLEYWTDVVSVANVPKATFIDTLVTAIALPTGFGILPLVLSFEQAGTLLGLGKTKLQQLVNRLELETAKVDGRTLILTRSAIALIERNLVGRAA